MTVAALRREMSQREFMQWQVWHGRRNQQQELAQKRASAKRGR